MHHCSIACQLKLEVIIIFFLLKSIKERLRHLLESESLLNDYGNLLPSSLGRAELLGNQWKEILATISHLIIRVNLDYLSKLSKMRMLYELFSSG
jgi:hypothetical protein